VTRPYASAKFKNGSDAKKTSDVEKSGKTEGARASQQTYNT